MIIVYYPLIIQLIANQSENTGKSESGAFETESGILGKSEYQVHVLDGLTRGSLDKIIYYADHVKLPSVFTDIKDTLVGVHDHLQVGVRVNHMDEGLILVAVLVKGDRLLPGDVTPRTGTKLISPA